MPLITNDVPSTAGRNPWRGLVVGVIVSFVFIVGIAFVARATRDGAGGVPHDEVVGILDAGALVDGAALVDSDGGVLVQVASDGGVRVDAGPFIDAGPSEGPEGEADSGPALVEGPPINAADVVAVTLPLVEDCLKKALRFDPSLGGRARLHIVVADGKLAPTMPGASSPVLSQCVAAGSSSLAWPTAPDARHEVEARIVLDGLRKTIRVESTELLHDTAPE